MIAEKKMESAKIYAPGTDRRLSEKELSLCPRVPPSRPGILRTPHEGVRQKRKKGEEDITNKTPPSR